MFHLHARLSWFQIVVLVLLLCPLGQAQSMQDAKVIAAYPLTMEKVEKKYQATIEMAHLFSSDAAFRRQMQNGPEQGTLEAQTHYLEAVSQAAKIIEKHGLSVRDYVLTTMALNTAMFPRAPQGLQSRRAGDDPAEVAASPEHVKFVEDHREEIKRLLAQAAAAHKAGANSTH